MRPAPLLCLLPAFAAAQDVPSLQRSSAALPITESIAALRGRLGGAGGPFAAAQLALKGRAGTDALFSARRDPDPLRRLDAAFGLTLAGTYEGDLGAAWFLTDPDLRVSIEAEHGLRLSGIRAQPALFRAAFVHPEGAASRSAELLTDPRGVLEVARRPRANGRGGAIRALGVPFAQGLPIFEAAAKDRRPGARFEASRRIVFGPKTPARAAALDRLSRSTDPAVRLSLVRAMDEDPGSSLDSAYERAQTYGAAGSRRNFARMVAGSLYEPTRLRTATVILGRLSNDPAPAVGDAAVEELYQFLEDRLFSSGYGSSGIDAEDVPWDGLPPTTVALLRQGVGRRLRGGIAFKAAVVLARLHDRRAYPFLAPLAFGRDTPDRRLAVVAIGTLGDRRATPRLLARLRRDAGDFATYDALQRLRDPAAIPSLLNLVRTGDSGRSVPILAAQTIAAIGDRSAAPALVAIARSTPYPTNLYIPIARLGGPEADRYLLERLVQDADTTLQDVTLALGETRDPCLVAELKRLALGGGPRANSARQALETIAYRQRLRTQARGG